MRIESILRHKGTGLVTILPADTIEIATRVLADKGIGALVVRDADGRLAGIVSERDVVRALAERGAAALSLTVADLMTRDVVTCRPGDAVKDVMAEMTVHRIRHLPVVEDERIVGIVSIGDVVKSRLQEKVQEVAVLRDLTLARG